MARRQKTAVALRHVAFEDLGTFEKPLAASGYAISCLDAVTDDLTSSEVEEAGLLIVLGGPIGVYEAKSFPFLERELALLRRRLSQNRPTLGICLGSQLIAQALGAEVRLGGAKEIGWSPLTLTAAGQAGALRHFNSIPVLHWHGDTFDLPEGATLLASTPLYPHQAFSWREYVLALQFHPEVSEIGLERWYVGHCGEIGAVPGLDVSGLRRAARRYADGLRQAAERFLREWLTVLPS